MSTLIHEFTPVASTLPGNNTAVNFYYAGATQRSFILVASSTPKVVSSHHSTVAARHVPVTIASTSATPTNPNNTGMAASVSFNPVFFFFGLFLMAVSIAMVWYILKRGRPGKVDLNKFSS